MLRRINELSWSCTHEDGSEHYRREIMALILGRTAHVSLVQSWMKKSKTSSYLSIGLSFGGRSSSNSSSRMRYKSKIGNLLPSYLLSEEEYRDGVSCIAAVQFGAVDLVVKHLKLSRALAESLGLCDIVIPADVAEKWHYDPFVAPSTTLISKFV